jgi:hypothetical protein
MADVELLVYALEQDDATGRFPGQVVAFKTFPHSGWGLDEGPPTFFHLLVTDVDLREVASWVGGYEEVTDVDGKPVTWSVKTRARVEVTNLSAALRAKVAEAKAGGAIPRIRMAQLRPALRDEIGMARVELGKGNKVWPLREKPQVVSVNRSPEEDRPGQ